MVVITLFSLLCAYVGSYYRLSRRGMREEQAAGLAGFLYIPVDEVAATHDLTAHHRLTIFYAPLNLLDCEVFGGERPVGSIMWDLSR